MKLYGLFHRHRVRRKHYETQIKPSRPTKVDENVVGITQARGCIQLVAMAFPKVSIRLFRVDSNTPETAWNCEKSQPNDNIETEICNASNYPYVKSCDKYYTQALRRRMNQLCGIDIMEKVRTEFFLFII